MSLDMSQGAWTADLAPPVKFVLLALADYANREGICWPSIDSLSKKTGLSRRQTQRHLKALRESGEIEIAEEERGWRTRRYYLKGVSWAAPRGDTSVGPEWLAGCRGRRLQGDMGDAPK